MLIDSHCHLDFDDFDADRDQVLARMQAAGVMRAVCISVNLPDWPKVRALAEQHAMLYASAGVHPDYPDTIEPTVEDLLQMAEHPKVVAIGETGLDYYRLQGDLEWQRERFRTHIRAARACAKPLVIHTRAASADTLRIMAEEGAAAVGGVMHCFTETAEVAAAAVAMNFYVSFSGIITFKNAAPLREVVQSLPLDRILVETDAPYLAPVPHRGRRNEPAWVAAVAAQIAQIKGLSVEEVAAATTHNAQRLFGWA